MTDLAFRAVRQPSPEAAPQIALPWIVRLRYGMAIGPVIGVAPPVTKTGTLDRALARLT